jgi:hypothetical protein
MIIAVVLVPTFAAGASSEYVVLRLLTQSSGLGLGVMGVNSGTKTIIEGANNGEEWKVVRGSTEVVLGAFGALGSAYAMGGELQALYNQHLNFSDIDINPGSFSPKNPQAPKPPAPNKGVDPPGTLRNSKGRLIDAETKQFVKNPNATPKVQKVVGSQNHHLVSNPIVDALEEVGLSRETAMALRNNPALQKMSAPGGHVGWEKWHRAYDRHMADWVRKQGTSLKVTDFFDEINRYYQSGEAAIRIPGVNLGVPQ